MVSNVLMCGVVITGSILIIILYEWYGWCVSLDKCVSCHTRIWPWQRGGAIYNSSWHKRCELASSKGSESTRNYWQDMMTEHGLMPPDEFFRCTSYETVEGRQRRIDGISDYLCKTWGLIEGRGDPPSWAIDAGTD